MAKHILTVGSINMDLTIHTPRQPLMGETITGSHFQVSSGGKGANQAAACARLGGEVKMIGSVGTDIYGEALRKGLEETGVGTQAVEVSEGASGIAVITVCEGDNCIILDEGANARVTPEMIRRNAALFDWADVALLQLEIPVETVLCAAQTAREHGAEVMFNPAPMKPFPQEMLTLSDWLVLNRTEAGALLGQLPDTEQAAEEAIGRLRELGPKYVLLTLGAQGSICLYENEMIKTGIFHTPVVDTTAAGDSFIAGVAVSQEGPEEALAFAAAVSALTVSRAGAQISLPSLEETKKFRENNVIAPFGNA